MRLGEDIQARIITPRSLAVAVAVHVAVFVFFWVMALPFKPRETVIPIELTFEAPPEEVAEPPVPPTPTPTVKPPPPPPPPADEKIEAVVKVPDPPKVKPKPPKPKPPEPKPPEPKVEPPKEKPKPEPPKKTAAELRAERIARMQRDAKPVKNPNRAPVHGKGKKLDPNWKELLNDGYKPAATTQLAANEEQRCVSLIRAAFYAKWERPAWTSSLREMQLEVNFGAGGKVTGYRLVQSSGDGKADRSVTLAASRVVSVAGLSAAFLKANPTVIVRFKVTPQ